MLSFLFAASGCSDDTRIAPPAASGDPSLVRSSAARVTVAALLEALTTGDADDAASLGVAGSRDLLRAVGANVRSLHVVDLSLRFIDDRSTLGDDQGSGFGPGAWTGTVEVRYRLRDWDLRPSVVETPFTFVPGGNGQLIAGIGGADGRTPLWLAGAVTPLVRGRALVIARGNASGRYLSMAGRAVSTVGRVLPDWTGRLVIEVPATEEELDQALDAPQDRYANIAAVTAPVDGSLIRGAPVHVFVNPRVFDALGPRGAQVVISHESTHVATQAPFAAMPSWLSEGFADYVALAHSGIPVGVAAAQILARIRSEGPPKHLPTTAELSPTAPGLGATYEEAWLVTRFIARVHGERKLVAFYQAVDGGRTVEQAFRSVLGTTGASFVARWRTDLRALANGVAG